MNTNACPICKSKEFEYFSKQYKKKIKEKLIIQNEALYQCIECGTITVLPKKKFDYKKDGNRYYGQMRLSEDEESGLLEHIKFAQVPKYDFFRKEILDIKFPQYKKWLDVGSCGYSTTFVNYDFTTIEPDIHMVSLGQNLFDEKKIFCSDLISFETEQKFDAILFNHSFYCISTPYSTLKKADKLLEENGLIFVGIGHVFMDAIFTHDANISSVEDILLGQTQKIYYCPENLQYLFGRLSYELVHDFLVKHNVPCENCTTRYLVFKKNQHMQPNQSLKFYGKEKINSTLTYYKDFFYKHAKINLERFNTKNTLFIGSKNLIFEANSNFNLESIFGFIDYDEEVKNCTINAIDFIDYRELKNDNIDSIIILDLKRLDEILDTLENRYETYKDIYYPTRQLSSGSLYYEIKLEKYISNTLEFKHYSTIYNRLYRQIKSQIENKTKNVAIFGTAKAGKVAYEICKRFNLHVECFIDDYVEGEYLETGIPIVTKELFFLKYASRIGLILKGPDQKGLDTNRLFNINVLETIL